MGTMPIMVKIGSRLKDLRIERAMTQEELAREASIGKNTVNRIEKDRTEPRPPTIKALARALGVEPSVLVRNEER